MKVFFKSCYDFYNLRLSTHKEHFKIIKNVYFTIIFLFVFVCISKYAKAAVKRFKRTEFLCVEILNIVLVL